MLNPLSCGVEAARDPLSNGDVLASALLLIAVSAAWLMVGVLVFNAVFSKSKQFKWTY